MVVSTANINGEAKTDATMVATTKALAFTRGNLEAMMQSGRIWSEGMFGLSKSIAESGKAQLDEVLSAWKAMSGVSSPTEAIELQTALARHAFHSSVETTSRITEASLQLMEQTMAPLTARVKLASETVTATKDRPFQGVS